MKIYLAGPEVFFANALEIGERKKAICRKYGVEGLYPLDAALDLAGLSPADAARLIYRSNIALIDESDALIANMTPFRGPGLDGGTAFEMGYAAALGIPIYSYTNDPRTYLGRSRSLGLVARIDDGGRSRDALDLEIEDFGLVDNLMPVCASADVSKPIFWRAGTSAAEVLDTGLAMFESAVQKAAHGLK